MARRILRRQKSDRDAEDAAVRDFRAYALRLKVRSIGTGHHPHEIDAMPDAKLRKLAESFLDSSDAHKRLMAESAIRDLECAA